MFSPCFSSIFSLERLYFLFKVQGSHQKEAKANTKALNKRSWEINRIDLPFHISKLSKLIYPSKSRMTVIYRET